MAVLAGAGHPSTMNWFSAPRSDAAHRARQESMLAIGNVKLQIKGLRNRMLETEKTIVDLKQLLEQIDMQREQRAARVRKLSSLKS